ncbi:outer membrane protein assembly factor BamB family protein [Gimesia alba]|uniref:outer membrane protein assembly factor BamB family protein n=1 Tax=Gimesia alba TaxID=2527973 RepID=UPI001E417CFC|nr:PQQ-binding-like beta-propeller repeat protein [Gimesia alba]
MNRLLVVCLLLIFCQPALLSAGEKQATSEAVIKVKSTDWPWWRGPQRNGIANSNQNPPMKWSETENIIWKTPVPGRGYSSPTVVGNRIYLASADTETETQFVLCYDRATGKQVWKTIIHKGGFSKKGN